MEKMLLRMVAEPTSHGSMRIVKEPGNRPGDDIGAIGGLKVSKKAVSPFSDLHVRLMAAQNGSCRRRRCLEASGLRTGGAAMICRAYVSRCWNWAMTGWAPFRGKEYAVAPTLAAREGDPTR
jgi:hypothetical protein